jgi:hypothetical protein
VNDHDGAPSSDVGTETFSYSTHSPKEYRKTLSLLYALSRFQHLSFHEDVLDVESAVS